MDNISYFCGMNLIYGDTNAQIISRMGYNCKRYRIAANLTQQELAVNAGVGVATVKNFENGKLRNVTLDSLLRMMRAIGILEQIESVLPELPVSPFEMEEIQKKLRGKQRQRVKHQGGDKHE